MYVNFTEKNSIPETEIFVSHFSFTFWPISKQTVEVKKMMNLQKDWLLMLFDLVSIDFLHHQWL